MLKYSNNEVAKTFVRIENAKHMLPPTATSEEIMQRAEEKDIDKKLYSDYLNGEKEAFELLYNKYKNRIEYKDLMKWIKFQKF